MNRFYSNYFESGRGFRLEYDITELSQWTFNAGACGGNFTTPNAILSSPLYPNRYPHNADCPYIISQPKGTHIRITVLNMDIDYHESCSYDHLEIRDGTSELSQLVGEFCGHERPPSFSSSKNTMWIRWNLLNFKLSWLVAIDMSFLSLNNHQWQHSHSQVQI